MELLPENSPIMKKKNGFRSLKLLMDLNLEDDLPEKPFGVNYGVLDNGLSYYVRTNSTPKMRAALQLAVKVGSVLEDEEERGVAHILEHLAFSATMKYTNHDLVKFLESVGAEFGACQNAFTSADETVYWLIVPVDKPELLSQAISILAEFSSEIRVSAEDLEKERGIVMEELRGKRTALGRMAIAHWLLRMEGSKYAERLPIGLKKVIQTVSPEIIKHFYRKWYHMKNMAVIAVGDFSDTESVVELIKTHFNSKLSTSDPPVIPYFQVPAHEKPRISCFVDSEAPGSAVMISCKLPVSKLRTLKDYRESLVESMFFQALNQRFFKISRKINPPYLSCLATLDVLVRPVNAYVMTLSCKEKGTVAALESMLTEAARVRLHGFSEREISVARAALICKMESAYLKRDQMQSTALRDACLQHFLRNKPVVGIEYEAQLQKTILPNISASEVSRCAENFRTSSSCVIKTMEPRAVATVDDLKSVVLKINSLEENRSISPWDDENIPEEIVALKPTPGNVVKQLEHPDIGATELVLSNGMRVCYKCTDFFDDQVLFTGFSYGGLSEVPESDYISCSVGLDIARDIGVFGYKPSVLTDMLAGKRAGVDTDVGAYKRTLDGYCSPSDLETALELVYQLFTTNVELGEEYANFNMEPAEERVHGRERDPYTALADRVRELIYDGNYFFRPKQISDLRKVDPYKACKYFNKCFRDPSTFTVIVVGNIDPTIARPLILQYLGGIPRPSEPIMSFDRDELQGLPFTFPTSVIREDVHRPMVEAQSSVKLCFPVEIKDEVMMEDLDFAGFWSKLLKVKLMQVLRFKHGQIYSVGVREFYGANKPSRNGDIHGHISVKFSCNPELSWSLVDLALDEIERLQEEGPSDVDVSSVLEIEERAYESGLQENNFWLNNILESYLTRIYDGDVGITFKALEEARSKFWENLTPRTAQLALKRILPFPCKEQYTVVVLMPQASGSSY